MISRLILFCIFAFLTLSQAPATAQTETTKDFTYFEMVEDSLSGLARTVLRDSLTEHRQKADTAIKTLLQEALSADNAFQYPFSGLQGISIQYPQDSTFRIFTWQLYVSENDYRYGGFLQHGSGRVYPLEDHSAEVRMPEYEGMSPDYWYGAVYYNIKQAGKKRDRHYLLIASKYSGSVSAPSQNIINLALGSLLNLSRRKSNLRVIIRQFPRYKALLHIFPADILAQDYLLFES